MGNEKGEAKEEVADARLGHRPFQVSLTEPLC